MTNFLENPTVNILANTMKAVSLRHKAISNNIANINTPNYKRQLVSFENELKSQLVNIEKNIYLNQTNSRHIGIKSDILRPEIHNDLSTSLRTDGNNVDIDMELAILAENTVKFNVLSQTISKNLARLNSVIKGGR